MKTIGLLGGMSWESTTIYYQALNRSVRDVLGGLHSAKILLHSVDFAEIAALQSSGDWDTAGRVLAEAAAGLEQAGADMILICTNTMHKVAPAIEAAISVPLLHITDSTALEAKRRGFRKLGLLGSAFTMEQAFYRDRMKELHDIEIIVPDEADRQLVHRVIFDELCCGQVTDSSRKAYLDICEKLRAAGADAVILGCTEIGLLIDERHTDVPLLDSTHLHATAAIDLATRGD